MVLLSVGVPLSAKYKFWYSFCKRTKRDWNKDTSPQRLHFKVSCHDSFICVTWLIQMCAMTPSYVWCDWNNDTFPERLHFKVWCFTENQDPMMTLQNPILRGATSASVEVHHCHQSHGGLTKERRQHTATCYNTLQHTALASGCTPHCIILRWIDPDKKKKLFWFHSRLHDNLSKNSLWISIQNGVFLVCCQFVS